MYSRFISLLLIVVTVVISVGALLFGLSLTTHASTTDTTVVWTDIFDDEQLDSEWSWIREDPSHWSLINQPGFMQINVQHGSIWRERNDAKNLLLRDAPEGDFEIETQLIFTPGHSFQFAGLLVYEDDDNWMRLGRAFCEYDPPVCAGGNGIYFHHEEEGVNAGETNYAMTTTVEGEAYLRIVRHGSVYTGYVSENGTNWTLVGAHQVISGMVPMKVGLIAENMQECQPHIPAEFDYFTLRYDQLDLYLPLILNSKD